MRIGVDYYPEHWDKSRWPVDAEMMQQANISVIRIGEFAWSLYEPTEGRFEFGWMDEALDFFGKAGIHVVLCTPSATPPKWMADKYPEIYQDDIHGNPKIFGTRKHYCFNSDLYRRKTRELVGLLVERYANHPAVEAWQIDNELGWANTTRCYCRKCEKAFRNWLREKYRDIDALNRAYGTVFWSQIYNSFDEVIIPRAGACYDVDRETQGQNPGLLLDFYRFSSDSVIGFMSESAEIIRRYSDKPITANMLDAAVNSGTGIDYFRMSKDLDFVSWDNYIEFQWGIAEDVTVSRDHALLRSYKKKPFWVMEQQSGPCGWSKMNRTPTPGKLRLWTYQATANGADTVVYFRWRTCPFGTEEYWHGILNHDGLPNRRYEEISRVGTEMKALSRVFGPMKPSAKVAIVKSFDSEWSHSIHPHVENFHYDSLLLAYYKPFYEMGLTVDFVSPGEELSGYQLVLAPALLMVTEEEKAWLEQYAEAGGRLLISFRSGIKNMDNRMLMQTVPGVFSGLAGVEINDYDPQYHKQTRVSGVFGEGKASLWCDIVEPVSSESLGEYISDFYAGKACLTANGVGSGKVYYLGCDLDDEAMGMLMEYLCAQAGISRGLCRIKGVETVQATDGEKEALFIMNHNDYAVVVPIEEDCEEMLSGEHVRGVVRLNAYDVAILK